VKAHDACDQQLGPGIDEPAHLHGAQPAAQVLLNQELYPVAEPQRATSTGSPVNLQSAWRHSISHAVHPEQATSSIRSLPAISRKVTAPLLFSGFAGSFNHLGGSPEQHLPHGEAARFCRG
jgi:hypothetical protein